MMDLPFSPYPSTPTPSARGIEKENRIPLSARGPRGVRSPQGPQGLQSSQSKKDLGGIDATSRAQEMRCSAEEMRCAQEILFGLLRRAIGWTQRVIWDQ